MKEELIIEYNKGKLYVQTGFILLCLLFSLYSFIYIEKWSLVWIALAMLIIGFSLIYARNAYLRIKKLTYYIKCDDKGIYTHEAFDFCPYSNIINIELKRYMGYQTLYFEVKEANLKTRITPMEDKGKVYYCLPLADCALASQEVERQVMMCFLDHRNG